MKEPMSRGELIHLLHRASQCAGDAFQTQVTGDLTPRQYTVLSAVAQREGLSQTDLTGITGIDRSTMADLVRRLVKKRLVHRHRSRDDARAYVVRLTEEGHRTLKGAEPSAHLVDQKILSALPMSHRVRFLESLSQIVLAIDDEQPRAS